MSSRAVDTVEAIYCDRFGTDYINQMITLSQKPLTLEKQTKNIKRGNC